MNADTGRCFALRCAARVRLRALLMMCCLRSPRGRCCRLPINCRLACHSPLPKDVCRNVVFWTALDRPNGLFICTDEEIRGAAQRCSVPRSLVRASRPSAEHVLLHKRDHLHYWLEEQLAPVERPRRARTWNRYLDRSRANILHLSRCFISLFALVTTLS